MPKFEVDNKKQQEYRVVSHAMLTTNEIQESRQEHKHLVGHQESFSLLYALDLQNNALSLVREKTTSRLGASCQQ
jgi:hypothetical protein